ncbi:M1 family aminopeptidase [Flavitalea sp. BT771]|uniref:M1 family aminopeptidase n=1 Tax=Flavitalea sp. BT771 TaxID=3063329 RepID=UPI0026E322E6|nr:M1 family aminopeptidase [Flavitalea sp. BT771]MDO6429665.1 M1 family aminopeptidase [Flavitalea sp. BT771]MDV6218207.1 M1 family aminopeptidase [Flavitalea sp. BT771]
MQIRKRPLLVLMGLLSATLLSAQQGAEEKDDSWKKVYRSTATKLNDLVDTRLDVKFDYDKSYMYGKAWVTLKPHFYPTDSLALDAKGMDIHKVAIVKDGKTEPLKYEYDGMVLHIHLGKTYKYTEKYTVFVDYTSKPNEVKTHGSAAITDAKGLYFINPKGEEKGKPTQIWTQGETEANSTWFPTIDKPNQKTTEEITMTVPAKYVTLSNGKLVDQKVNGDGTRTDHWKMDLPHAPYLFFMGVGEYSIIKDSYKGKEVSYYVEKEYAPFARGIFGNTPEMIAFYSRITGVDYPWQKYSQIVGRDYVSGAMENTTCTLHGEGANQDARELSDGNGWEDVIAHELFHQWFGDYVTTESWSNITLNESFADYSETLWNEHKYGKDAGDAINYQGIQSYLSQPENAAKDLVRFHYSDKEDVFDQVSYPKGGRILNMLRNYVGDSAFFKSLNLYLTTNKFKSAEAQNLRLAFEEITGQDLNWYWNQWYYGSGHPKLSIDYVYDDNAKTVKVIINQTQEGDKVFRLPIAIDVYNGATKARHKVWIENKTDTFTFTYSNRPDLVNVDGDKILLCEKKDNKTLDNFIHQYKYAGLYVDRREAIAFAAKNQEDPKAQDLLKTALKDRFYKLRNFALQRLDMKSDAVKKNFEPLIADVAANDKDRRVKGTAIEILGTYDNPAYKSLFAKAALDSSYTVAGNALAALSMVDSAAALDLAKKFMKAPAKGALVAATSAILIKSGDESSFDGISDNFEKMPVNQEKFMFIAPYSDLISKVKNTTQVKRGVDLIVKFREAIPQAYRNQTDGFINNALSGIAAKKAAAGLQEQADYIKSKIQKGF